MIKGNIDSIAFDLTNDILAKLSNYGVIIIVKSGLVLDQELCKEFKTIKQRRFYDYLAFLHTQRGLRYEITKQCVSKSYRLTFKGLWQYTETSELMRDDLKEIVELLIGQYSLARVDICIDQNKPFSVDKIAKRLKRRPHHYRNTTYLKTAKEGKTNKRLNVKHYKKGGLYRLEFSFDKRYLKGGSDEVKNRLLKVIKKAIKNDSLSFANSSLISGGTEILQKHFTNADSNGVSEAL